MVTHFFGRGTGKLSRRLGLAEVAREAFRDCWISHGHAHRFRHTLAVKLLSKGVAVNHVAAILGNSPAVVENIRLVRDEQLRHF